MKDPDRVIKEDSGKVLIGFHQDLNEIFISRSCQDLEVHPTRIFARN